MKNLILTISIITGVALAAIPTAGAGSLDQRVEKIDQKQRILERNWELQQEKNKETTLVTIGKEGFTLKSGDSKFVLKLRGLVQADGRFLCQRPTNLRDLQFRSA